MTDQRLNEFDGVTPCPAPPQLRASVLAAVDRQLSESGFMLPGATAGLSDPNVLLSGATAGLPSSAPSAFPCTKSNSTGFSLVRLSSWTVAASLLIGIGLCVWQQRVDARLEALYGPAPTPTEVAELIRYVESVSGPGSGRWLAERLLASKSQRVRQNNSPQEPFITTFQLSSMQ